MSRLPSILISALLLFAASGQSLRAQPAWVTKSGTLLVIGTDPPSPITAVTATPTVTLRGKMGPDIPARDVADRTISLSAPAWFPASKNVPFVAYVLAESMQADDVLVLDAPAGWYTSVAGPAPAAAAVPITNWAGRMEGATGPYDTFAQAPKLRAGVNVGAQPSQYGVLATTIKNHLHGSVPWAAPWTIMGDGKLTASADGTPISWTKPGSTRLYRVVHGTTGANGLDNRGTPSRAGQWTLRWDDPAAGTDSAMQLWLSARYGAKLLSSTVTGATTTAIYDVRYPEKPPTWELDVGLNVKAPAGTAGLGYWTASDVRIVGPDARTGEAQPIPPGESPLAPDDNVIRTLTADNGRTIGPIRFMDATMGFGGSSSDIFPSDMQRHDALSWNGQTRIGCRFVAARKFAAQKVYGPQALFCGGSDAFGRYLQLPPSGVGQWIIGPPGSAAGQVSAVMELRSAAPHPFTSGQLLTLWVESGGVPVPITQATRPFLPNPNTQGPTAWVTGPNTIAVAVYIPDLVPSTVPWSPSPQQLDSATEIDLTAGGTKPGWSAWCLLPAVNSGVPYRYTAAFAKALPESTLWVNIPMAATDALVAAIAREVAAEIGPANRVRLEYGNEIWNGMLMPLQFARPAAALMGFLPDEATALGPFKPTGKPPTGDVYGSSVPIGGHLYDVFEAAWTGMGLDPARIERCYGSWWAGGSYRTGQILAAAQRSGYRVDQVAIAPYFGMPGDAPVIRLCNTAPPAAINDFFRHWMAYSLANKALWKQHRDACAAAKTPTPPALVCYEGGIEVLIPAGVKDRSKVWHDCYADPSYRDVIWDWYMVCQAEGCADASYFCLYNGPDYQHHWALGYGPGQLPGDGSNNKYAIKGPPGDGRDHNGGPDANVSTGLQGLRDWISAMPSPIPSP